MSEQAGALNFGDRYGIRMESLPGKYAKQFSYNTDHELKGTADRVIYTREE
ncbi:MAG: hypothetical protein ACLR0U_08605 [Enterocloster clostridioformis]